MGIRLIALDLDGTLLTSKRQISEETLAALEAAAAKGVYLVPCTGRTYFYIPEIVKNLPFVRYMITVAGARIYDGKKGNVLLATEIPLDVANKVLGYVDDLSVAYACCQNDELWIEKTFFEHADEMIGNQGVVRMMRRRIPVENLRRMLNEKNMPLEMIQLFFDDPESAQLELMRLTELFPMCTVEKTLYNIVEVKALNATKGGMLARLCEYLEVDLSECMVLGDECNDISMFNKAGISVAMGNAKEEVKCVADWVTDTNNSDGVAKAIQRYVL